MRPVLLLRFLCTLAAAALLLWPCFAGKKKDKEEVTQTLAEPPEPPTAAAGETRRLVFHVSALSSQGMLTRQTRDAIRAIERANDGMPVLKIRAFVAGVGDLRRIPQLISEEFAEKKHATIPAVTVVQAGGLPMEGAQVVLESVSEAKRDVNPLGLIFVSARERSVDKPLEPLLPLARESLSDVAAALNGRGEALRVTCFASTLDQSPAVVDAMRTQFPAAVIDLVQTVRVAATTRIACEAVGRVNAESPPPLPNTQLVTAPRIVFSGSQIAYGLQDAQARLAFERLNRVLSGFGASLKTARALDFYPLSGSIAAQIRRLEPQFVDHAHPPASTILEWENLPGMDATFAMEAIAPAAE